MTRSLMNVNTDTGKHVGLNKVVLEYSLIDQGNDWLIRLLTQPHWGAFILKGVSFGFFYKVNFNLFYIQHNKSDFSSSYVFCFIDPIGPPSFDL